MQDALERKEQMRDPARIDRIIGKLRALWHKQPDARLGQLIVNLHNPELDTFFVEDDIIEREIDINNRN